MQPSTWLQDNLQRESNNGGNVEYLREEVLRAAGHLIDAFCHENDIK